MEELEIASVETKTQNRTEEIYVQAFPRVAAFISHMGGSFRDARDIFHDALVIYFESTSQKQFKIHTSEEAYILGIAKHLWIRKYNGSGTTVSLSNIENEITIAEDYFPTVEDKKLLRFLESAGKKCMDLLRAFYYEQLPVKKLAKTFGFSNEHSASVQKHKCLEKVRETIKQKSLTYEDFIE